MLTSQRKRLILDVLASGRTGGGEAAERSELDLSEDTIRRDLRELRGRRHAAARPWRRIARIAHGGGLPTRRGMATEAKASLGAAAAN